MTPSDALSAAESADIGALVVSLDHTSLGIGKIVATQSGTVTIEYFDSVANPAAGRHTVSSDRVVRASLERQLRVYFRDGSKWSVGRVMDEELGRVQVRPPGDTADRWLGIEELFVRWDEPLDDPVAVLRDRAWRRRTTTSHVGRSSTRCSLRTPPFAGTGA